MTLDKDFEIRCQQIWAEVWIASLTSHPRFTSEKRRFLADTCISDFCQLFEEDKGE